jgi:hypothetical protein
MVGEVGCAGLFFGTWVGPVGLVAVARRVARLFLFDECRRSHWLGLDGSCELGFPRPGAVGPHLNSSWLGG